MFEAKKAYRTTLEYKRAVRKFKVKRSRKLNPFARCATLLSIIDTRIRIAISRFVKEYYDRNSTLTFLEQGYELGAKWRALSESEKDVRTLSCVLNI